MRDDSKADDVYDELVKAHDLYLGAHTVSVSQVKRLIQMLIDNTHPAPDDAAARA